MVLAEKPADRSTFQIAAVGALLVVVLFAGYGMGRLNEGAGATPAPAVSQPPVADPGQGHHHDATPLPNAADGVVAPAGESVGGLAVTSHGLTLVPESASFAPARSQAFRFTITGAAGVPITTYAVVHDKPLHLVVIRRDLSGFQHLHPVMAPDGTWSVPLTLAGPGSYRAIADFTAIVGGRPVPVTLGVDLTVAGDYAPAVLPAPVRQAVTAEFEVSYEGEPRTGATQPLLMTVTTRGGTAALEPYLGAFGHLVVLREGDVGYVHVHPEERATDGKVKFWLAAPGPGRYRMFFDFQVAGQVHTAAWTVAVR